ncbi:endonuclease III [candidate division KSB1 bacterium]|nr:MAG: endonuclease III [candidate division KSB1 bacterium]
MPKSASPKSRALRLKDELFKAYPGATCALTHHGAFQLAVATILSAQCTDERVNIVTRDLFKKYKTPRAFAEANAAELEMDIRPTGFFRNKARSIQGFARAIAEQFGGEIPKDLDLLVKLPGIGRKTANVILGTAFGIPSGVVVDTHVSRLSQRMGLTEQEDPEKIEQDLMKLLPQEDWINFSHTMIWHGRQICNARKPKCSECPLAKDCPKIGVTNHE